MKNRLEIRGVKLKGVPVFGVQFFENGAFVAMCFSTDLVAGHFEGFGNKVPALQPDTANLNAAERARVMLAHIADMNNWAAFYEHVLVLEEQVRARLATGYISVDSDNAVNVLWARQEDLHMWESLLEDWELPSAAKQDLAGPPPLKLPPKMAPGRQVHDSTLTLADLPSEQGRVSEEVADMMKGSNPLEPIPVGPEDLTEVNDDPNG